MYTGHAPTVYKVNTRCTRYAIMVLEFVTWLHNQKLYTMKNFANLVFLHKIFFSVPTVRYWISVCQISISQIRYPVLRSGYYNWPTQMCDRLNMVLDTFIIMNQTEKPRADCQGENIEGWININNVLSPSQELYTWTFDI